jgi:hypothetical protein
MVLMEKLETGVHYLVNNKAVVMFDPMLDSDFSANVRVWYYTNHTFTSAEKKISYEDLEFWFDVYRRFDSGTHYLFDREGGQQFYTDPHTFADIVIQVTHLCDLFMRSRSEKENWTPMDGWVLPVDTKMDVVELKKVVYATHELDHQYNRISPETEEFLSSYRKSQAK